MEKYIKALMVEPDTPARCVVIQNNNSALRGAVGGFVEARHPWDDSVYLLMDEEAQIKNLPYNRVITDDNRIPVFVLQGPCVLVGADDNGFASLSDSMLDKYGKKFAVPDRFEEKGEYMSCYHSEPEG